MQRKKLDGRGIAPHSEPLTKIHALRKERDNHVNTRAESMKISIHALRKERDCEFWAEGR